MPRFLARVVAGQRGEGRAQLFTLPSSSFSRFDQSCSAPAYPIATFVVFGPLESFLEREAMARMSFSSQGHGRGVQATKDTERKRKREPASIGESHQAADAAASRWSPSIVLDGEVQKLKVEGSFPPALDYRITLFRESFPAQLPDEQVLHFDFFGHGLGFPCTLSCGGFSSSLDASSISALRAFFNSQTLSRSVSATCGSLPI